MLLQTSFNYYVAHYLTDFSRRWGELEGFKSQVWVQSPGTVSMGEVFLDAYKATGDEYYYQAAEKTNKGLYAHRTGTGVKDGHYWWDYDDKNLLAHYGGKVNINIQKLKDEYTKVNALSLNEAIKNSPLKSRMTGNSILSQSLVLKSALPDMPADTLVKTIINSLDNDRWLVKHGLIFSVLISLFINSSISSISNSNNSIIACTSSNSNPQILLCRVSSCMVCSA